MTSIVTALFHHGSNHCPNFRRCSRTARNEPGAWYRDAGGGGYFGGDVPRTPTTRRPRGVGGNTRGPTDVRHRVLAASIALGLHKSMQRDVSAMGLNARRGAARPGGACSGIFLALRASLWLVPVVLTSLPFPGHGPPLGHPLAVRAAAPTNAARFRWGTCLPGSDCRGMSCPAYNAPTACTRPGG